MARNILPRCTAFFNQIPIESLKIYNSSVMHLGQKVLDATPSLLQSSIIPSNVLMALQIIIPLRDQSVHCIPSQESKKKKGCTCTLILDMWHDFIIPTTFLSYLFNWGDVHESFILFKSEKLKAEVYGCFGNHL